MTLVEGIGDEVIHFFSFLTVIFFGLLAWWSTNISETPLMVLILERRSRNTTSNPSQYQPVSVTNSETTIDTGQDNMAGIPEIVETTPVSDNGDDKEENESSSLLPSNSQSANVQISEGTQPGEDNQNLEATASIQSVETSTEADSSVPESDSIDSDSSILRQRRLRFFNHQDSTLLQSSNNTNVENQNETSENTTNVNRVEEMEEESVSADQIRIRLKYLNDDQIVVEGRLQEQLGDFKRRHFRLELAAEKVVRLIFNGQVLQCDNQTLQGYGLFDNCVVHCLIHTQRNMGNSQRSTHRQTSSSRNQPSPPDWNLSTLLYTCLSVILGFAWYCRYQYSHLFTVTTTAALCGLTGMFGVTLLGVYMPDQDQAMQ